MGLGLAAYLLDVGERLGGDHIVAVTNRQVSRDLV